MSDVTFEGRVAVVTGAGGGLGRCHALLFADRGARVVVNDLGGSPDGTGADASPADAVVKEILARGGEAVASYDSVTSPEGGAAIVQTALDAYGRVDVVINNAGILRDRSLTKLTSLDLDAVIDVHLRGAFHLTLPAFAAMKSSGYGRFVHTTSAAGLFGNFGQANYAAAKTGLLGLSRVVSIEGAKIDIRSNVIAPIARTRLTEQLLGPLADDLAPEQISGLVAYLASESCEVTGEVYSVGGGSIARVFVGLTPGWFAGKGTVPSPDDVAAHLGEIRDTEDFTVPGGVMDEVMQLLSKMSA